VERILQGVWLFVGQTVGPNPDLFYPSPLTGIPGAIQGYMKNSLAGQLLGKAASGIESLFPVNRRAIIENEALGSGFRLNDILINELKNESREKKITLNNHVNNILERHNETYKNLHKLNYMWLSPEFVKKCVDSNFFSNLFSLQKIRLLTFR